MEQKFVSMSYNKNMEWRTSLAGGTGRTTDEINKTLIEGCSLQEADISAIKPSSEQKIDEGLTFNHTYPIKK